MSLRAFVFGAALLGLAACGGGVETTRSLYTPADAPAPPAAPSAAPPMLVAAADMAPASRLFDSRRAHNPDIAPVLTPVAVRTVKVVVPTSLDSSEVNSRYPLTDIVWRGEPVGNRRLQVASMLEQAALAAGASTNGIPAYAEIELLRFHGLTQKTRYSTGGEYNVHLIVTIRDVKTGAVIRPPHRFSVDQKAWGAGYAANLDSQGITEKQFVLSFLTRLFQDEFLKPSYKAKVVYE